MYYFPSVLELINLVMVHLLIHFLRGGNSPHLSSSLFTPTQNLNIIFKSEAKGLMVYLGVPDNLRASSGRTNEEESPPVMKEAGLERGRGLEWKGLT